MLAAASLIGAAWIASCGDGSDSGASASGSGAASGGSGGAGATTTATGGGAPDAGPDGAECQALYDAYKTAFDEAVKCTCSDPDPCVDGTNGDAYIADPCGCSVGANAVSEQQRGTATKAKALYLDWVDAGCGPRDCPANCASSPTVWHCGMANGSACAVCSPT